MALLQKVSKTFEPAAEVSRLVADLETSSSTELSGSRSVSDFLNVVKMITRQLLCVVLFFYAIFMNAPVMDLGYQCEFQHDFCRD